MAGVVEAGEVFDIGVRPVRVAVKEMHSYTTPAILVIPVESIDEGYLDWIMVETEAAAP